MSYKRISWMSGVVCGLWLVRGAMALPTENNFVAVTNDWRNGNYSNVYELAQVRLAANSNDLVAVNLLVEYNAMFSDVITLSNSVDRLIRVSDNITQPAYSNAYYKARPVWLYYRNDFLAHYTDDQKSADMQEVNPVGTPINCSSILEILRDADLW